MKSRKALVGRHIRQARALTLLVYRIPARHPLAIAASGEHTNEHTNQPTNKHGGSQYSLRRK